MDKRKNSPTPGQQAIKDSQHSSHCCNQCRELLEENNRILRQFAELMDQISRSPMVGAMMRNSGIG